MASLAAPAFGADDALLDYFGMSNDETVALPSHFPRPASSIAENVTVVTAEDIERINAHTLADVLQTLPGIQLDYMRTPGTFTFFNIQGTNNNTILVLIDGVRQNDFAQNKAEPGLIPVQQIERIEIIKGAASTAWGSALGGVINIITKTPNPETPLSGLVSGSIGNRFTADSRAELTGTVDRLGYYLTAGNLHSDGLLPNNGTNQNNLYGKLSWLLPSKGNVTFGFSYLDARRGIEEGYLSGVGMVHDDNVNQRINGFMRFTQPLAERINLEIDGYLTSRDDRTEKNDLIQGEVVPYVHDQIKESSRGFNARLNWGDSRQNVITGVEYSHDKSKQQVLNPLSPPVYDSIWDRWAAYANGTITVGPVTILPGLRVDHTGVSSEYLSYTLGATHRLSENTVLRAYCAHGYGLPQAQLRNGLMKVRTLQGGFESGDIPYLWVKGTYFLNWLRDIESIGNSVLQNQDRQGFELEARTVPLFGLSLSSGYTFTYVKDVDTGDRVKTSSEWSVPPHLWKLALNYDNADLGLRGTLNGNYLKWNASTDTMAADGAMIWDLFLSWKLRPKSELSPELFFSARNLFNGAQTTDTELFTNTPRWFEGGVRFRF